MSAWHDPDRTVVDAFLVKSQFRPGSVPTYRWFLRTFEDVARRHPAVDRQMLEAWLKEMARRWRMSTLLNQVCIVDRFLDHLAEIGLIADNPIVALRRRYNVKHSKPIWRALASQSRRGTRRVATACTLRQRAGRLHARSCRADAQPGLSV
jgi:hypothetical protein